MLYIFTLLSDDVISSGKVAGDRRDRSVVLQHYLSRRPHEDPQAAASRQSGRGEGTLLSLKGGGEEETGGFVGEGGVGFYL